MIRTLLASSAAAALLATNAAAGPTMSPTGSDSAWQMAQTQTDQPAEPPAAGEPSGLTAQEPADQTAQEPADQTAQEPGAGEPADQTAEEPAADEQPEETAEAPAPMDQAVFITEQAEKHWLATDYIGDSVYNLQDEQIGSIDDLIVVEDGGLVGFVVGVGGFLGIGKKQVAIDLDAVEIQQDEEGRPKLVVAGSRDALLEAPDFVDKATQKAEQERREREAQQPAAGGGATGGMGGAPGAPGTPGAPGQ